MILKGADLLYHVTQLISRNNAKSHHAKKYTIISGN